MSGVTDADYYKPVPEEVVMVRRSDLDPNVWYCVAANMNGDISSLLSPGRLRAVKRYAEQRFSDGEEFRWVRQNIDTWVMEFV